MPRKKRSELAAGLFIISALAATVAVVIWLGAADIFRPARARAFFYLNEKDGSTGLKAGSFVEINDKEIGRIAGIRHVPAEKRTLYEVVISEEGVEVHSDATARVSGLLGDFRLVIVSRGTAEKPPADAEHPASITGGLEAAISQLSDATRKINTFIGAELDRKQAGALMAKVHTIADNINEATDVLAKIAATLKPETEAENEKSMIIQMRHSIANVKATTANLRRETDVKEPKSLAAKTHGTIDDVKAIAADAKPKVSKLLTSAAGAAEKLEQYSKKDIAEIFATLRKANDKILAIANDFAKVSDTTKKIIVLNRENIDTMIDNMTQVSATLKATSEEIRANPWRLLRKPTKEDMETYNVMTATAAFSQGATTLNQAITKLKSLDPKIFQADDPQIKAIREHLNETFKKFKEVEDALYKEMQSRPS